jgi:hypothetical protein
MKIIGLIGNVIVLSRSIKNSSSGCRGISHVEPTCN